LKVIGESTYGKSLYFDRLNAALRRQAATNRRILHAGTLIGALTMQPLRKHSEGKVHNRSSNDKPFGYAINDDLELLATP
jgi:hypothetical protein